VITIQTSIPGSKVFRFENFWVAHSGFSSAISTSWAKPTHKVKSAANINAKFKRLRYDLKYWSRSISKLTICIENSNKALMEIDKIEDARPLSGPEKNFRRILKAHLAKLLEYQNAYWKRRCTIRWTKFDDENTKFFHSMATERYRRNNISALITDNGDIATAHAAKEEIIYQSFKQRLGSSDQTQMLLDLGSLIQPTPGLEDLSSPFTKEEIDTVVSSLPIDMAPGPDGFNGQFLKSCWHIIKEDIYQLFLIFMMAI
jgi:hypothetical protein